MAPTDLGLGQRTSLDLPPGIYNAPYDEQPGISYRAPQNDDDDADDDILKNLG